MSKNPANRRPKQRPSGHCPQTPAPLWASQNFLTSSRTIRRLLACTDISPQDLVVEIGPGKGHITRELLPRCGSVLAAELDSALCARLRERFAGEARLRLWQGDFLTMPLPKGHYKVFANIPFSHTTDILRRLSQAPNPPACAWLVVERGAAMRFAGQGRPGLSALMLAPFFQVRIAASIPREQFHPAPRVDAVLLELRRRPQPDLPPSQRQSFRRFLEQGLSRGALSLLSKKQLASALGRAGLPLPADDSNMKYVQWLCLFRAWRLLGRK
ncbi:MAG: 23S ribosomal RNA methyltransferase Erm [Acutalibacter sp.]|jgi:23S rRNA (adenine-N6)-dimethyltransferase|nr:23S ribosomal RNA methyltransferase Erm [Acutalibacter sp.]